VACWSTKAAISLKRMKIEEKVTVEGLQELTNALSNGTILDPPRPPLPQDLGVRNPHPKRQSLLAQERVKLWTSNLTGTFKGYTPKLKPIKILGVFGDCPNLLGTPIISGTGEATDCKFCTHIHGINRKKSPLKISRIVAVGVVRDSRKFSGHSYIGTHRAVIFAIAQLSCRS